MKRVVITFGRFNPPTTGHEKLLNAVKKAAGMDDYKIFTSHSQDKERKKSSTFRCEGRVHERNVSRFIRNISCMIIS